ncbi:PhnD/SsuA/transferrin family substrate-binding protein [Streptomyces sp. M10(2022)]
MDSLEEYKGKKVCLVDPNSTSGYLYPKAALANAGVNVETDTKVTLTGGQDASVIAVNTGQCEAGFAADSMVDTLLPQKGTIKQGTSRSSGSPT